jgi:putative membrane protein
MKKYIISSAALAIAASIYACNNPEKSAQDASDTTTTITETDTIASYDSATMVRDAADTASNPAIVFAAKAGAGGMMEVQLGTLAQTSALNPRVKNFGKMMVNDHSKANKELTALASGKNFNIPSTMPVPLQNHINELKKFKAEEFDKRYMDMMVDDHKEDISLFEEAAANSKDADIKAFAAKTLPILKMHLDSAKAIKSDLK